MKHLQSTEASTPTDLQRAFIAASLVSTIDPAIAGQQLAIVDGLGGDCPEITALMNAARELGARWKALPETIRRRLLRGRDRDRVKTAEAMLRAPRG